MCSMEEYKRKAGCNLKFADMLRISLQMAGDLYVMADAAKEDDVELANLCTKGAEAFADFNKQVAKYISDNAE